MTRSYSYLLVFLAGLLVLLVSPISASDDYHTPTLPRPAADNYVVSRDGHFFLKGERIRFWGYNIQSGAFPTYAEISHVTNRLANLGVNAVRLWPTQGTFYDAKSIKAKRYPGVEKRDGSLLDRYDFFVSELGRHGIFIENPGLHYLDIDAIRLWPDRDVQAIIGPHPGPNEIRRLHRIAPYLSAGWEAMLTDHIRNYLSHVNPYTGHSYADEPIVAGWELANESSFVHCMLRTRCVADLPPTLRDDLARHWQHYWRKQGGQSDAVLPVLEQDWDRVDSPLHSAYRHFVYDRFVEVSRHLESVARQMGPVGKGVAVQPFTYSTQAGDPLLVARAAYSAGDYSTIGAYQTPLDRNRGSPYYPYRLNLSSPIYYNFNYGAVAGKPTVVYENSFFRPYLYRAEWPWSMLYLAAQQDWDGVYLYTYGQPWAIYATGRNGLVYGDNPLPIPSDPNDSSSKGVYVGLHHGGDEVTVASWAAAGLAFLRGDLSYDRPEHQYVFSTQQIFGPAPGYCSGPKGCIPGAKQMVSSMNEASLAGPIRLVLTDSPRATAKAASKANNHSSSSHRMTLLRGLPRLVIDTPSAKAVSGALEGEYRFDGGYVLQFPYRQFGFVSVESLDGTELLNSHAIRVQAAGKSSNSGFTFDPDRVDFAGPTGIVKGVSNAGHSPVTHTRVEFKITFPREMNMLTRFDFNLHAYQFGPAGNVLSVSADEPFFAADIVQ